MNAATDAGSDRMRDLITDLPAQLAGSGQLPGLGDLAVPAAAPRSIVLVGMGGSAIAGDLVRPLLSSTRLEVRRDYGLPTWVDAGDLVLVSSYSGDTEETLAGWHEAGRRGCPRLALTTGGELGRLAAAEGIPVVTLPPGLPPRAALGHGLGALVGILDRLGCVADGAGALAAAVTELERLGSGRLAVDGTDTDGAGNPHPHRVARDLVHGLAVIHTAGDGAHAAGLRLGAQLNENSKVPALVAAYPELDHNELVGWADTADPATGPVLILLRATGLSAATDRRVVVTDGLLAPAFRARHAVVASGSGPLAEILSLVQWGDALSWHLARLRGVDPVPVERIKELKRALAAGSES